MTPTEVTTILRQFNEWQRGCNAVLRPSSIELGEAIDAAVEMIERLEAAESDALEQARLSGMGSEREAALMAKLEATEKERDFAKVEIARLHDDIRELTDVRVLDKEDRELWATLKAKSAEKERDNANAAAVGIALQAKKLEAERDELRAKIEAMEKQEPFDADSDVFRGAFEAALKAGNWPMTRQGDGYRSPSTQIAWRVAFSTVNRLRLYLAPGAQPAPSVPVDLITDYLVSISAHVAHQEEPQAQAEIRELLRMLAAAQEAKP